MIGQGSSLAEAVDAGGYIGLDFLVQIPQRVEFSLAALLPGHYWPDPAPSTEINQCDGSDVSSNMRSNSFLQSP